MQLKPESIGGAVTNDDNESVPTPVYGALQASRFPLQSAVAHAAGTARDWKLLHTEYPWCDSRTVATSSWILS